MYVHLLDCSNFYVEHIDNSFMYQLRVAYIVTISTSTWNCISIGSMENKAN
jgi:hypothetical protein